MGRSRGIAADSRPRVSPGYGEGMCNKSRRGAMSPLSGWRENVVSWLMQVKLRGTRLCTITRVAAEPASEVNPHYLDHVIHTAESRAVELSEQRDADLQVELMTVVGELEWRMRELERESLLRAGLLPADESAVIRELIARLKGQS